MHFSSKLSSSCYFRGLNRLFFHRPAVAASLQYRLCQHRRNYLTSTSATAIEKKHYDRLKKENFDILGTWDSRIELPLELESSINLGKPIPKISVSAIGTHSMQGRYSCQFLFLFEI